MNNIEVLWQGQNTIVDPDPKVGSYTVPWVKIRQGDKVTEGLMLPSSADDGTFVLFLGCRGSIPLPPSEQKAA